MDLLMTFDEGVELDELLNPFDELLVSFVS